MSERKMIRVCVCAYCMGNQGKADGSRTHVRTDLRMLPTERSEEWMALRSRKSWSTCGFPQSPVFLRLVVHCVCVC